MHVGKGNCFSVSKGRQLYTLLFCSLTSLLKLPLVGRGHENEYFAPLFVYILFCFCFVVCLFFFALLVVPHSLILFVLLLLTRRKKYALSTTTLGRDFNGCIRWSLIKENTVNQILHNNLYKVFRNRFFLEFTKPYTKTTF